jgi:hypothetical protein
LEQGVLPEHAVLLVCSSHEERCLGVVGTLEHWKPSIAAVFHYQDPNPARELNHAKLLTLMVRHGVPCEELPFSEGNTMASMRSCVSRLRAMVFAEPNRVIVIDMSVFTKRHLLMIFRWLDDEGLWDRVFVTYTEPNEYDVSPSIPLSFGLASIQDIPGFSASPDLSRPVHLVLFLGYEGDRALAAYEHIQPMKTTLVIPEPPYKAEWNGRTEELNAELLTLAGRHLITKSHSLEPTDTVRLLDEIVGLDGWSDHAVLISPLGTKAQTLGVYMYARKCLVPPAIIYVSPSRHNHEFFSQGIGACWLVKRP